MTPAKPAEPIIDPGLPIVDAHHHLWFMPEAGLAALEQQDSILSHALAPTFRRHARYLFDEFLADLTSGHDVRASIFIDARAMYRAGGPEAMKSVGEIEFVNGIAAMSASGLFGEVRVCAAIVGGVDLSMGDVVEDVLTAHIRAGGERYRGVRGLRVDSDEDASLLGPGNGRPHVMREPKFRAGFGRLQKLGLSYDAFILEPQLPELAELARAFPATQIILNHVGTPVGVGRYAGQREERFPIWRKNIQDLAKCANAAVKIGGLALPFAGFKSFGPDRVATSEQLAGEWRPYVETCIEAFGADRCMFESNFPVDAVACSYPVIWNTFKRLTAGASKDEKTALFSGTATRIYRPVL